MPSEETDLMGRRPLFPDPIAVLAAREINGREASMLDHWPYDADAAVVELARAVVALRLEVAALKRQLGGAPDAH